MKAIKFIKDHEIGISKGEYRNLSDRLAQKMIDSKHAEECDVKEIEKLEQKRVKAITKENAKQTAEAKKPIEAVVYKNTKSRMIDEIDLESNMNLVDQGFEEGDFVYVDEKDNIIYNEDGKAEKVEK